MYGIKVTDTTNDFPLATTAEAKSFGVVQYDAADTLIDDLILAAGRLVEQYCGRTFGQRTYRLTISNYDFEDFTISLPMLPIRDVTEVKALAGMYGTEEVLTEGVDFIVIGDEAKDIELKPRYNNQGLIKNPLQITFTAGYDSKAAFKTALPDVHNAVLRQVATWFANREDEVVGTVVGRLDNNVKELLSPYREPTQYLF